MATATRTRPLASQLYITDGTHLLYVLDLPEGGQAVVEDAMTGDVQCVPAIRLDGWKVVDPNRAP